MKKTFSIRLKKKHREPLEEIAKREEESVGEIIRRMIDEGIKKDSRDKRN